jgi:tRNA G10  N-methylase Trm11
MSTYYFQLGNTPQLSVLELEYLTKGKLKPVTNQLYSLETEQEIDIESLQRQSGGLVKTYQWLANLETNSPSEIESRVVEHLAQQTGKVIFNVANLSNEKLEDADLAAIKKQLTAQNVKSRYLDSGKRGLNAAVLSHQKVHELVIIEDNEKLVLAKTVSIQDIDDWTKRDRRKPYADRKKGMLPPKVARMMVNIAKNLFESNTHPNIHDPFCGSGTILMEALMMGCNVSGSDLDVNSIRGSEDNLGWLIDEYKLDKKIPPLYLLDAAQPLPTSTANKINAIVTEPFMGKPRPQEHELKNIFKGLYRTYLGAFKNWTRVLRPGGVVIIIFPLVEAQNQTYDLNKLIDKLSQLGYTTMSQPVTYSRPQAIVKRQLHFLRYKG